MASVSPSWYHQDGGLRRMVSVDGVITKNLKISFAGSFPSSLLKFKVTDCTPIRKTPLLPHIKCEKKDNENSVEHISVERYPYHSYLDSTSGELEPASGARASIPGKEYWPEGTANRVQAARAPEPTGVSTGKPSFGKNPGSRRKKYKSSASASASSSYSASASESSEMNVVLDDPVEAQSQEGSSDDPKDGSSEYVVYQTEPEEELSGYELDKKIGNPHPFVDPKVKKPIEEPLTSEELWWNWRKSDKEQWSRWQRRRPDVETVFLKAMAETGQIKLHGDEPTLTECALYRARKHIYKEERLQAERERLDRIGPIAYYSEWVAAWTRDTSLEAVQKHFEETGEDEITQLSEMFTYQTEREYRIMMGTDVRIQRDPLAMRMREDQIKQIWGGDPVYPTVNYIQDPDEVIDFRGPDFHEPTPDMIDYLKEHGKMVTKEEMDKILAKEKKKIKKIDITDKDKAMAEAVDIGEIDDEEEDSEAEGDDEEDKKSTPRSSSTRGSRTPTRKSKGRKMSVEEAISDSENLTDFILDFEEY